MTFGILSSQDRSLLGKNIADTELFGDFELCIGQTHIQYK